MMVNQEDFFRQATLRICGNLDIQTAMRRCLEFLADIMPAEWIVLNDFTQDFSAVQIIALASTVDEIKIGKLAPLPLEVRRFLAGSTQGARIVNRSDTDPLINTIQTYHRWPKSSAIILPLVFEDERSGSLILAVRGTDRYSDEHARLLTLLSEPFAIALSNASTHQELIRLKEILEDDNSYLQRELRRLSGDEIIGTDSGLKGVMELVLQVAPLNSPVLLFGETGVGKEIIAHTIHHLSPRREGPFILVNCGAIPETLIDSELFGHEKGAFTGAASQKRGRFERAHRGTVFLDEVGELPPQAQVRMLRVLHTKEIERVGGSEPISVDIRVVAATHRNLEDMVKDGRFREDLWFRLNVFPIQIPPLRERKEDIPGLVHHFIGRKSKALRCLKPPVPGHGAIDRLLTYSWPGNVRELENVIERAMILNKNGPLTFDHLVPISHEHSRPVVRFREDEPLGLDAVISEHIQKVLMMTGGKIHGPGGAAEMLAVNPSTLRNKMDRLGISYGRKKGKSRPSY